METNISVVFNESKNELFTINDSLKSLQRKLKSNYRIITNTDTISLEVLSKVSVFVIPGPRGLFSEDEFSAIKEYISSGGSLLVMLADGGEKIFQTNINFLLEEFGIMINNDSVIRTHYFKQRHPKECLVLDGVINKGIAQYFLTDSTSRTNEEALRFLYAYGATLNVVKPAVPILSSGTVAFPMNRPICALCKLNDGRGKVAVIGSGHLLSDKYIHCESNDKIRKLLFDFLIGDTITLNLIDAEDPEISDYTMAPDISFLSEKVRSCLQESVTDDCSSLSNYLQLFDQKLFSLNMKCIPKILKSYDELSVKHEYLRLIPPQFNPPLPQLQPAVFQPAFRNASTPNLELFDLEDTFGSERMRLAQLANKCILAFSSNEDQTESDVDIDYFIREAGNIVNIATEHVNNTATLILQNAANLIIDYKKNLP